MTDTFTAHPENLGLEKKTPVTSSQDQDWKELNIKDNMIIPADIIKYLFQFHGYKTQ